MCPPPPLRGRRLPASVVRGNPIVNGGFSEGNRRARYHIRLVFTVTYTVLGIGSPGRPSSDRADVLVRVGWTRREAEWLDRYGGLNPAIQRALVPGAACARDRKSRATITTGGAWRSTGRRSGFRPAASTRPPDERDHAGSRRVKPSAPPLGSGSSSDTPATGVGFCVMVERERPVRIRTPNAFEPLPVETSPPASNPTGYGTPTPRRPASKDAGRARGRTVASSAVETDHRIRCSRTGPTRARFPPPDQGRPAVTVLDRNQGDGKGERVTKGVRAVEQARPYRRPPAGAGRAGRGRRSNGEGSPARLATRGCRDDPGRPGQGGAASTLTGSNLDWRRAGCTRSGRHRLRGQVQARGLPGTDSPRVRHRRDGDAGSGSPACDGLERRSRHQEVGAAEADRREESGSTG